MLGPYDCCRLLAPETEALAMAIVPCRASVTVLAAVAAVVLAATIGCWLGRCLVDSWAGATCAVPLAADSGMSSSPEARAG